MAQRTVPSRPFELKGWHVGLIAAAFFLIVAGVNGVMLTSAISTMPGLDARNGYDVSQRYNGDIAAAAEQAQRGWRADVDIRPVGTGSQVMLQLANAEGAAVAGRIVTLRMQHPALRSADQLFELSERSRGRYESQVVTIPQGAWTVVLEIRDEPQGPVRFTSRNRMVLKS